MDIYRMLWFRFGARPWTYIARDVYHKVEYLILVSLVMVGYTIGQTGIVNWKWFLVNMVAYTIGYVHGHFLWGQDYVPSQKVNGAEQ
jgi:hypothetical protein